MRYKHITVVDDDIDIHDYAAVDWAIAYRVNAGEDDIVIMPSTFGAGLDPSTRRRDRNPALFGTGKWNRVLIDATMNLDYDPDPDLGGARFPPKVWPDEADIAAVTQRWGEFNLKPLAKSMVGTVSFKPRQCPHAQIDRDWTRMLYERAIQRTAIQPFSLSGLATVAAATEARTQPGGTAIKSTQCLQRSNSAMLTRSRPEPLSRSRRKA